MNGEFFVINEAAGDNFDYSNLRIVEHKKKLFQSHKNNDLRVGKLTSLITDMEFC